RVQKSDTIIVQNYLSDKEVSAFNRLSTAFLDLAELRAERQIISTMADWKKQLDDFLTLYEYDKYNEADTISAEQAKEKAYAEYDKFRLIQDNEFLSDFDKELKRWKEKGLFGKD
ncbi:RhuM family protein, partial [uncultured Bacteroides sp.]